MEAVRPSLDLKSAVRAKVTSTLWKKKVKYSKQSSAELEEKLLFPDISALAAKGRAEFVAGMDTGMDSTAASPVKKNRRDFAWSVSESLRDNAGGKLKPLDAGQSGGVYSVRHSTDSPKHGNLAVFKPKDEERFERGGVMHGEGAVREYAAYLLDCSALHAQRNEDKKALRADLRGPAGPGPAKRHVSDTTAKLRVVSRMAGVDMAQYEATNGRRDEEEAVEESKDSSDTEATARESMHEVLSMSNRLAHGFSGVPSTVLASVQGQGQGAIQEFMQSKGGFSDWGPPEKAVVPVQEVQKVALLDVRLCNTDRHLDNLLKGGSEPPHVLIPIDHGCVLPAWYALEEVTMDWREWSQAREPLTEASLAYIRALDLHVDSMILQRLGIRAACIDTLRMCTLLLKTALAMVTEAGYTGVEVPVEVAAPVQKYVPPHLKGKAEQEKKLPPTQKLAPIAYLSVADLAQAMCRGCAFDEPSPFELAICAACQHETVGVPFDFAPGGEHDDPVGRIDEGSPYANPTTKHRLPSLFFVQLEKEIRRMLLEIVAKKAA